MQTPPGPGQSGQALVEFSIVLMLLWVILAATIQCGIALHTWLDMEGVARDNARHLSITGGIVCTNLHGYTCSPLPVHSGGNVTVTVTSSGTVLGWSFNLTSTAVMPDEPIS